MNEKESIEFLNSMGAASNVSWSWERFVGPIRKLIMAGNINEFLTWDPIRQTMRAGSVKSSYSKEHFDCLKKRKDWDTRWSMLNDSSMVGMANHVNIVNQAHYLSQLEDFLQMRIEDIDYITEFGAGFGNFCHLTNKLGFNGQYIIFDFPELLTVQKYYLTNAGVSSNLTFECDFNKIEECVVPNNSLFVSMHALEETPIEFANRVIKIVDNFSYFFFVIGSGPSEHIKNYLNGLEMEVTYIPLPFLKPHCIMAGKRNE